MKALRFAGSAHRDGFTTHGGDIFIRQRLNFYASQFVTAEINASFYRTPSLDAVKSWVWQTPSGLRVHLEGVETHNALEAFEA